MTIEQFRAEYHLLDRVSDGTVETHHAQATAGVMVMVHFLRGADNQNATILERIERLETGRRQKVLRIVEVDGVTAVVTRFILDLTSFGEWLDVELTPADSAAPNPPRVEGSVVSDASATRRATPAGGAAGESDEVAPRRPEPGDFTVAFRTLAQPADAASPVPPPAPSETTEPERPVTSPEQKPSAPAKPTPWPPSDAAAWPVVPTPSPLDAPDPPPAADPPPVAPPPTDEPPAAASWPPSPPFQPPGRPMPEVGSLRKSKPREQGGYTRLVRPQPMPEPPPRGDGPPSFPDPGTDQRARPPETGGRLHYGKDSFRERLAAPSPDASPSPPPATPLPPPSAGPIGPGAYTKVIESMPAPNLGAPQRSPSPAPPPPPPKPPAASNKLLVFGLLGVLLTAILFVVIFTILT